MFSMPRPIIGITIDMHDDGDKYESPFRYSQAIELAGGLPLLIPYKTDPALIPQYVDLIDGILFTGGNDLDPAVYGQSWHPKAEHVDPARQNFEMALLAEVERRRTPTLGICMGSQIMNVYRGGSMHQFLPEVSRSGELEHRKVGTELRRHPVKIDPNSQIGRAIGKTEISVNTYHKQAADKIGRGFAQSSPPLPTALSKASKTRHFLSSPPFNGIRNASSKSRNTLHRSSCWWRRRQMQNAKCRMQNECAERLSDFVFILHSPSPPDTRRPFSQARPFPG